ncbi:TIGR02587 family membrane protein [Luteolibacter flavescens]|uniref:TIGR02587 family membrane protein n=1 Tax=Luteolibacter flavescens TaxID=1859460 RepID=A0ABT3FR70_9BACT|nr:TIGR02587 family membrane protein [Luteolibacter flavescens]MCW1885952.1 TIGR02587 family membrane protein [Luteolibacter flavescens]
MEFSHYRTVSASLLEYGRGIAGGLIFSLPLLYTMEVWWSGFLLDPWRILLYVIATFALLLLYNRFAGLRRDATFREVAIDSVEEMGLGLVIAAVVLWLTGQLDTASGTYEVTGKVVMEAMTVAIGVSVGTSQLGGGEHDDEGMGSPDGGEEGQYLPQVGIALCGAVLFAANVAATEEIMVIAMDSPPSRILLLAVVSMLGAAWTLTYSGMHGADRHVRKETRVEHVRGIVTTYAVALIAAAGCLYFFGRFDGQPLTLSFAMCVVAGVPASLGASAGRLLLQS